MRPAQGQKRTQIRARESSFFATFSSIFSRLKVYRPPAIIWRQTFPEFRQNFKNFEYLGEKSQQTFARKKKVQLSLLGGARVSAVERATPARGRVPGHDLLLTQRPRLAYHLN